MFRAAWVATLPGVGLVIAVPLYIGCFYSGSLFLMVLFAFLGGILLAGAIPAIFAAMHLVCGSARRAMAVAIAFFFANLIGLGCGPLIAGALSEIGRAHVCTPVTNAQLVCS